MPKLSIQTYYPTTVALDGAEIDLRITRLAARDAFAFLKDFERAADPPSERSLIVRVKDDELEKRPVPRPRTAKEQAAADALVTLRECLKTSTHTFPLGDDVAHGRDQILLALLSEIEAALPEEAEGDEQFVLSDQVVRARRLDEMTPEQRAAWDVLDKADEQFATDFIVDTITNYVTAEPGQIEVDGQDITSGADLVRLFGAHAGALKAMVRAVRDENVLPSALKNAWRSARDSRRSSTTSDLDLSGQTPAATATAAAPEASAPPAAATA